MTEIIDRVPYADGRWANGRVVVSWPSFQMNGTSVVGGMQTWEIVDGVIDIDLYSNVNARPLGVYYTAAFELDEGPVYIEYWRVPDLPVVTLGQIRIGFPITPSALINALQLTSGGAQYGMFLGWDGTHWVPMYVTTINISPNTIALDLTADPTPDLEIMGSPAALGAGMTLNVPDASCSSRGVVTTGPQTFCGDKTFEGDVIFNGGIIIANPPVIAGYVPDTRRIDTPAAGGLQGGGSLAANLTLSQIPNSTVQRLSISQDTLLVGTRKQINFIQGPNIDLTIADNAADDWVDVRIAGDFPTTIPPGTATGQMLVWQNTPAPGFWTVLPKGAQGEVLISGLVTVNWGSISGYVPTSRLINTTAPLQGGGSLAADLTLSVQANYFVQTTRIVGTPAAGGLQGGGPLTADLSLSQIANSTLQRILVYENTVLESRVAGRRAINFIAGPYVQLLIADNPAQDWVDVTIASDGPGLPGPALPTGTATGDILVWNTLPSPGEWTILPRSQVVGEVLTSTATTVTWMPPPALSPGTTTGDLMIWDQAQLRWVVLPKGATGTILRATAASISWQTAGYVPTSFLISAGYGLTGGGPMTGVSVTLAQVDNTTVQKIRVSQTGTLAGTRHQLNFIAGPNTTLDVVDDPASDWVAVTIGSTGGGGSNVPDGTNTGDILRWDATPPGFWQVLAKGAAGTMLAASATNISWVTSAPVLPGTATGDILVWSGTAWALLARGATGTVLTAGAATINWAPPPTPVPPGTAVGDILRWSGTAWTLLARGAAGTVLTAGAANISWLPASTGQPQSPWMSDIDGAGHTLFSAGRIGIGVANPVGLLQIREAVDQNLVFSLSAGSTLAIQATNDAVNVNVPLRYEASAHYFMVGHVGVGTTNPTATLEVFAAPAGTTGFRLSRAGGTNVLDFGNYTVGAFGQWLQSHDSTTATPYPIVLQPNGGSVGIGITNPATTLEVFAPLGTTGFRLSRAGGTNVLDCGNYTTAPYGQWLQSHDSTVATNYPLVLQPNGGNVGVGTTIPAGPLHVREGPNQNLVFSPSGGAVAIQATDDAASTYIPLRYDASAHYFMSGRVSIGIGSTPDMFTVYQAGAPGAVPQFRMATSSYGTFWFSDANNFYLLFTNSGDSLGAYNSLRPFTVGLGSGHVSIGHGLTVQQSGDVFGGGISLMRQSVAGGWDFTAGSDGFLYFKETSQSNSYIQFHYNGELNIVGPAARYLVNGAPLATGVANNWVNLVRCSSAVNLSPPNTWVAIPGCSMTLGNGPGRYLILGSFDFVQGSLLDTVFSGGLFVNGGDAGQHADYATGGVTGSGSSGRSSVLQQWVYATGTGGETIDLRAQANQTGAQAQLQSTLSATWISP